MMTSIGTHLTIGLALINSGAVVAAPSPPAQSSITSEQAWQFAYQKDYKNSLQLCDQAIRENPNDESLQLQRATILSWAKRYRESIAAYRSILAKNPQSIAAIAGYAEVLSWDGQYDFALKQYQQVLTQDPNHQKALTGIAYVHLWKGDLATALRQFTALQQRFPTDTNVQLGLAKTYVARQEIKSAQAILTPLVATKNEEAIAVTKEINAIKSETSFTSRNRSSKQNSLQVTQTVKTRFGDSNTQQSVQVGYGKFTQPGRDVLNMVPIRVGIEGTNYPTKWQVSAGVDLFDRLAAQPFVEGNVTAQISPNLQVGAVANYQAYKENVATLENEVKLFRIQPHVYWEITPSTSLYAQYGAGFYSDGNQDGQLWAGLKQKLGQFYVEGSVFNWRFAKDTNNGYFAPSDYLSYGAELGWQGKVADPATCQLALSIGRQSYNGEGRPEKGAKVGCELALSSTTQLDASYRYSDSAAVSGGGNGSNEHRVQVNLKTRF
jgi:tetratricopeptide (TPR) repeat protein